MLAGTTVPDSIPVYRLNERQRALRGIRAISPAGGGDVVFVRRHPRPGNAQYSQEDEEYLAALDSGANRHLVNQLIQNALLKNKRPANLFMRSATGAVTHITEKGDIALRTVDAAGNELEPLILNDVSVLKGSPLNLLSVSALCEQGSSFHFSKQGSYFTHSGRRFPLVERNGLYILNLRELLQAEDIEYINFACQAQPDLQTDQHTDEDGKVYACAASYDVWHQRFGHSSKRRIKMLYDMGSVEGLDVRGQFTHDRHCTCPTCLQVNNSRLHIGAQRKFADYVSRKGQTLLTDICGPFPPSLEKFRYTISFTDEYSRFSIVYFLRQKSDAEAALKAAIEYYRRNGIVISKIRSDQGGEFGGHNERTSAAGLTAVPIPDEESPLFIFQRVCSEHGIEHELMPAHVPELHGLAERWNKTVMKMANAMLFSARLSHVVWPSAVAHANMLRNRLPVRGLGPYTPYEIFFGKRPRVDGLKVFGCDAYKLLPNIKVPGMAARKRLIYLGESSDRVGYRCLDPITLKFTHEYELIFDEESARKRVCALREHDARRELLRQGRLDKLPLLADDFQPRNSFAYRELFSSPDAPSQVLFDLSGEAAGSIPSGEEVPARQAAATTPESEGKSGAIRLTGSEAPARQRDDPSALQDLSTSTVFEIESRQLDAPQIVRPMDLASREAADSSSSSLHQDTARHMGGDAKVLAHRDQILDTDCTAPNLTSREETADDLPEEFSIRGPRLRPGHPRTRGKTPEPRVQRDSSAQAQSTLGDLLTDRDEAEAALSDREAAKFGPLTKDAIDIELEKSKLDPSHPCRPLRHLPVGQVEKDTPEFKRFRKFALDHNLPITLLSDNPKVEGSASWHRYNRYQCASTLRELIELSIFASDPAARKAQHATALKDIVNDALRGFIQFPQHECNVSTHYVDATLLARHHGTVNIHAVYAMSELTTARREAAVKESKELLELVEVHMAIAQEREARSVPFSFQEQIKALWDYDFALQLNEAELKKESAFAAAMVDQMLGGGIPEPAQYRHATAPTHPEREQWAESIARERATLEGRGTWELVTRKSIGKNRPVKCRYVFRKKRNRDGSLQFKSRLVACGYSQVEGMNFNADEVYASVCAYSSVRFLFSLACQQGFILSQADITGAYLEAPLDDDVYMECPPDMYVNGKPPTDEDGNGLKQSGYLWRDTFTTFLTEDSKWKMGFKALTGEPNMYYKEFMLHGKLERIYVCCYVDDTVIASSSDEARQWFMSRMEARFPVNAKSTGVITYDSPGLILSMNVHYDRERGILEFDQKSAIEALAARVGVKSLKPRSMPITSSVDLPKLPRAEVDQTEYLSLVGAMLHICQVSRPDCAYAIGVLSRHSSTPGRAHMEAARNLVSYLYQTRDLRIRYVRLQQTCEPFIFEKGGKVPDRPKRQVTIEERLIASSPVPSPNQPDLYADADFGGDPVTHRSTSGMVVMLNGGPISWSSRLQKLCAQSTAESEIYAATDSVKEAKHVQLLCEESGVRAPGTPMRIWEDNNACLQLAHNLRGSKAARHFSIRLRFLNEAVHDRSVEFARVDTKQQLADGFTKPLAGPAFFAFRDQLLHKPDR